MAEEMLDDGVVRKYGWRSIKLVMWARIYKNEVFRAGDATNNEDIFEVMLFWVSSVINFVKAIAIEGIGLR